MNINDFVKNQAASQYSGRNATAQSAQRVSGPTASGLAKAEKRIQAQVDTTTAQLSTLGKLKAAVAAAQTVGRALGSLSATASSGSEKAALTSLVGAVNSAIGAAVADTGSKGTSRVKKDFQRAVASDQSSVDALKKVGVSLNAQGSVVVDSAKLDAAQKADPAAVRATLTALGRRVDAAASQELDGTGRVGGALASLTQRASELQRQQSALASLAKYGGQS